MRIITVCMAKGLVINSYYKERSAEQVIFCVHLNINETSIVAIAWGNLSNHHSICLHVIDKQGSQQALRQ